jgi:hypothetical protein
MGCKQTRYVRRCILLYNTCMQICKTVKLQQHPPPISKPLTSDRPIRSSEMGTRDNKGHNGQSCDVKSAQESQKVLNTKTDWLTVSLDVTLTRTRLQRGNCPVLGSVVVGPSRSVADTHFSVPVIGWFIDGVRIVKIISLGMIREDTNVGWSEQVRRLIGRGLLLWYHPGTCLKAVRKPIVPKNVTSFAPNSKQFIVVEYVVDFKKRRRLNI